ncbi:MAG: TrmO family methyltransferase [Trueperaceae bacterium]
MTFSIEPVAFVEATRAHPDDDFWGGTEAYITLADGIPDEALDGIDAFSHVEVAFVFHHVNERQLVQGARHPRNDPALPRAGIFAQRAKRRPNRLGSTMCRVLRRDGRRLAVAELDALDGTPVVDLKPVIREFLPRGDVVQPAWVSEVMRDYWRHPPAAVEGAPGPGRIPDDGVVEPGRSADDGVDERRRPSASPASSRTGVPVVSDLREKLAMIDAPWSPRVVAELNDHQFKLAKFRGPFVWHAHHDVDEAFLVIEGAMRLEFRSGVRHLVEGQLCVVPRGVEHRPVADEECRVLLIEPRGVTNTGDAVSELRAPDDVWV